MAPARRLRTYLTRNEVASLLRSAKKSRHGARNRFIDAYRSTITPEALNSGQFAFKAFLIQVANHQSQDAMAVQFVQYDKLTDEQKAEVSRIPALIKLKQGGVVNEGLLRVGAVVKAVQIGLGNPMIQRGRKQVTKFSLDTHMRCWRRYNVRPAGNSDKPEFTDTRYCSYDKAHGDYLYTKDWVAFLVEKMGEDAEYELLYP